MVSLIAYDKQITIESVVTKRIQYVSKKYPTLYKKYKTDNILTF